MNLLFLSGAEMWDFSLMLSHLECPISGSQPPWPAVLGPCVCDQKLPGTMGSSGRREVMTYVFSLESSFSLCHGCGQFPVHWWRSYLTYPDPWPVLWHQLFCLQAPLLLSSTWDLSSEEEFPLPGTLDLKLGEWLQRLGVVFTVFIFLVIHFLVLGTIFGYGGSFFLLSYITCVRPWVQHGDN